MCTSRVTFQASVSSSDLYDSKRLRSNPLRFAPGVFGCIRYFVAQLELTAFWLASACVPRGRSGKWHFDLEAALTKLIIVF